MTTKTKQWIWYGVFVANIAVIFYFWWQNSGTQLGEGTSAYTTLMISRLSGLLGGYLVLTQVLLMSRLPLLERTFGLDTLSRHHQTNGLFGVALVISHVLTVTSAYRSFSGKTYLGQILEFLDSYQYINGAVIGFGLLVTIVALSLVIVRRHLRYETWYYVHLAAYGGVILPLWHQITLGGDLISQDIFRSYWLGLYGVVFGSVLAFRLIRPLLLSWRHRFVVDSVEVLTPRVVSMYITGRHLDRFRFQAGQFAIYRFLAKGNWWQAHPFSISWEPQTDSRLRLTIKAVGDFTATLPRISPGTRVLIDGPYGRFTLDKTPNKKLLFIAGGIGITPLRAMCLVPPKTQAGTTPS